MDEVIKGLLTQSPSAAVALVVTWLFLKEIRVQRTEYFHESQQRLQALKEISANHDTAHRECGDKLSAVVDENTRVISRNSVALERCEDEHRQAKGHA